MSETTELFGLPVTFIESVDPGTLMIVPKRGDFETVADWSKRCVVIKNIGEGSHALSAHNTQRIVEKLRKRAAYQKRSFGDASQLAEELFRLAMEIEVEGEGPLTAELSRLRSQGAGQWPQDAARAYHDEICPRHANSCADCINRLSEIIRQHAPVEGAQPRLGTCDTKDWPHLRSDGTGIRRLHERRESCTFWEESAGLASPPESQSKDIL